MSRVQVVGRKATATIFKIYELWDMGVDLSSGVEVLEDGSGSVYVCDGCGGMGTERGNLLDTIEAAGIHVDEEGRHTT